MLFHLHPTLTSLVKIGLPALRPLHLLNNRRGRGKRTASKADLSPRMKIARLTPMEEVRLDDGGEMLRGIAKNAGTETVNTGIMTMRTRVGAQSAAESRTSSTVFLPALESLESRITFPCFFPAFQILPLLSLSRLSFILCLMISLRPCLPC